MSEQATAQASAPEKIERPFTKAQLRKFSALSADVGRAQSAQQSFVDYLADEHELDEVKLPDGYTWQLGPKGFMAVASQEEPPLPPDNNEGETGDQENSDGQPTPKE